MKQRLLAFTLGFSTLAGAALAGTAPVAVPSGSVTDTSAFVGLNWTFGRDNSGLEGVVGVAHIETKPNGDSTGARLQVMLDLSNGVGFKKVKLTGMSGTRDAMGELGFGVGAGGGLFATGGLWVPYGNAGTDYHFDRAGDLNGFEPYIGVHSLGRPDLPLGTTPGGGGTGGGTGTD